jgi:predicted nucleotidyltransferase
MRDFKPPEIIKPILELYLRELFDHYGERVLSVALFGSFARGDYKPNSDIDLLLVIRGYEWREPLSFESVEKLVLKLWRRSGHYHKISPYPLTPEQASVHRPIYLDLVEDGIILFDRDRFLGRILDEICARLRQLGAVRRELPNGSKYWILKPVVREGEVFEI